MRIVAGRFRGRPIQSPPSQVRPTSDRVREALFASLTSLSAVSDASVLDLFGGSGALGLEALSRGATSATFIERDANVANVLRANVESLVGTPLATRIDPIVSGAAPVELGATMEESAIVHVDEATRWLERQRGRRFELVFSDPPYAYERWTELAVRLVPVLCEGAIVCAETRTHSSSEVQLVQAFAGAAGDGAFEVLRHRTYGETTVVLYRYCGS